MSVSLTNRQAEELSIIAYLSANNLSNVAETLREELGLEKDDLDTVAAKRYETLLEKKWKSNIRLQEKVMELESRNGALESEIEDVAHTLSKCRQDPASLLPEARPRHCLESHKKGINGVAFHPVYTSIASCSDDCTTKIWDWELGELERTLKGHTEAVSDVDYGGPTGGTLLATCSVDRSISLWDPANGYINIRTFRSHGEIFSALRFIPPGAGETTSGKLLVSASRDKILKIWDVTSGCCVRTLQGHTAWVRDVSPSPDGRFLLSTGDDMTALLWDISGPNPENKLVLADHGHPIECCAFAPHASYPHLAPLRGMKKLLPAVSAAKFVATGSRDNTIKIWDTQGTCLMTLTGHDDSVQALVFHPGGKYLLSASDDKTIRCWDLSQEGKCVRVLDAHDGFISCLRWAPGVVKNVHVHGGYNGKGDGKHVQIRCIIATGSMDSKLRIFAS